jgi:hypothetical protein
MVSWLDVLLIYHKGTLGPTNINDLLPICTTPFPTKTQIDGVPARLIID